MSKLFAMTKRWSLTISVPKTKAMVVGKVNTNTDSNHLTVEEHNLEFVNNFKYLGSIVSKFNDGSIEEDVTDLYLPPALDITHARTHTHTHTHLEP